MRTVEEHQRVVAGLITSRPPVRLPIADTLGLVLADDVVAPLSLPGFDNSAMDGYAVIADDIASATPEQPVLLPVAEDYARRALELGRVLCRRVLLSHRSPPRDIFVRARVGYHSARRKRPTASGGTCGYT